MHRAIVAPLLGYGKNTNCLKHPIYLFLFIFFCTACLATTREEGEDETETSFGLLANATELFRYALTSILVLLFKYTATLMLSSQ